MLTWFIKTKRIARQRSRSTPSRRVNAGAVIGGGGVDTKLLCGREWDEVGEENSCVRRRAVGARYVLRGAKRDFSTAQTDTFAGAKVKEKASAYFGRNDRVAARVVAGAPGRNDRIAAMVRGMGLLCGRDGTKLGTK